MTSLESMALDQQRWWATALEMKHSSHARFMLMVGLTVASAFLEALAMQLHSYPAASQIVGYSGALALALVLVIRTRGLCAERLHAWVLAYAAAQALKSEMYQYRTSCGPYAAHLSEDTEVTLLQRSNAIVEKLSSIQKYAMEPKPKKAALLGPLSADDYIAERVEGEIKNFQRLTVNLINVQEAWLKKEHFVLIGGILLAVILTFTHNQTYGVWVAVIAVLSLASGVTAKAERYATLAVESQAMPDRLSGILASWRANHGTLDQLVEQVEALLLAQTQAWIVAASTAFSSAENSPLKLAFHSSASRTGD
jgi:hypothetical protein